MVRKRNIICVSNCFNLFFIFGEGIKVVVRRVVIEVELEEGYGGGVIWFFFVEVWKFLFRLRFIVGGFFFRVFCRFGDIFLR